MKDKDKSCQAPRNTSVTVGSGRSMCDRVYATDQRKDAQKRKSSHSNHWRGDTAASGVEFLREDGLEGRGRRRNKQKFVVSRAFEDPFAMQMCLGMGLSHPKEHLLPVQRTELGLSSPHVQTKVYFSLQPKWKLQEMQTDMRLK